MAEQSYPFDAGAGAAVNEAQWQQMARRFRQTGVVDGSLNKLAVSADGSAMSVSVATGDAFVEGFFYRNDAAKAMTIATANATNPRIDTVVVRLDRVANTAALAVITGTAAASPVAPTLSATDSLYELPLANVAVPAAAGVILGANVTDRRTLTQTFDSAAYAAGTRLWVPKTVFQTLLGSPSHGTAGSGVDSWPVWLLDAATEERVGTTVDIPADWTQAAIDVYWTNAGAGSGNVTWRTAAVSVANGASMTPGTSGQTVTASAPAAGTLKATEVSSAIAVTANRATLLNVSRRGDFGDDTLANDAAFLGVMLRKVA